MNAKQYIPTLVLTTILTCLTSSAIIFSSDNHQTSAYSHGDTEDLSIPSTSQQQLPKAEDFQLLFPADGNYESSGCYIKDTSKLSLNYSRHMFPLKQINYKVNIVNGLVDVTIEQEYENPSSQAISAYYAFPVEYDSLVYSFKAKFENTVLQGTVKQKQINKKQNNQTNDSNNGQSNFQFKDYDIINMDLGNIPPKSRINIQISYTQQLTVLSNIFYKMKLPSSVSPNYMNLEDENGTLISNYSWSFLINLQSTKKLNFYTSPSHDILQINQDLSTNSVLFTLTKQSVPYHNFVFVYSYEDYSQPQYLVGKNQQSTTVLVSFIPQFNRVKPADAYNDLLHNKFPLVDIETVKGEYIFMLDRSGTMDGPRIQKAKEALIIFLKSLPSDSYFNFVSFGNTYQKMFPESKRYEDETIKEAISNIQKIQADFKGTEIYQPLNKLLSEEVIPGYPKFLFLLTDGSVPDIVNTIKMVSSKSENARVSTIGIGNGVERKLIEGIAKAGKGTFVVISDQQNPSEKIINLLQSSLTPVIIPDIKIEGLNVEQLESINPNPSKLPCILKNTPVNLYFTFKGNLTKELNFSLSYYNSGLNKSQTYELSINPKSFNYPFVGKMGHSKILKKLENLIENQARPPFTFVYNSQIHDFKQEAIKYSIKHQIISSLTSFVTVGKHISNSMNNSQKTYELKSEQRNADQASLSPEELAKLKQIQYVVPYTYSSLLTLLKQYNVKPVKSNDVIPSKELVKLQNFDGSWSQDSLIQKLAKDIKIVDNLSSKVKNQKIIITRLALLWLYKKQKFSNQYTLIIKKGQLWLRRQLNKEEIQLEDLNTLQIAIV